MEKEESLDLINALVRPAGAHTILDVMQRIAMIDKIWMKENWPICRHLPAVGISR
jgi:hypothetical protein